MYLNARDSYSVSSFEIEISIIDIHVYEPNFRNPVEYN